MRNQKLLIVTCTILSFLRCNTPSNIQVQSPPIPSISASLLTIKSQSLLHFIKDTYEHPEEPISMDPLSRQNANTLGNAFIRLTVDKDGHVLRREKISSNGKMWVLVRSSIYRLEFEQQIAAPPSPWIVDLYLSSIRSGQTQTLPGVESKPPITIKGEIIVKIINVSSAK